MKKYIRTERACLFEPNVYIAVIATIKGNIPVDKIENAIEKAYQNNESTMSKIVLESNGQAYYEKLSKSGCKIIIHQREVEDVLRESEKNPFHINEGELIRTFIKKQNESIELLIHAHHLAGDGKSIVLFLQDILTNLDGNQLVYKPLISMNEQMLKDKLKLPFLVKCFVDRINKKWLKEGKYFTWDEYFAIHTKYWEEHISDFKWQHIYVDDIKKQGTPSYSINSYIVTKLLYEQEHAHTIGIPISVRGENFSMSN